MRSPRLMGHIILGTGLGLSLLIAWAALSQHPGGTGWAEALATRSGPVLVKCAAEGNRLRPLQACSAATGPDRPRARQP